MMAASKYQQSEATSTPLVHRKPTAGRKFVDPGRPARAGNKVAELALTWEQGRLPRALKAGASAKGISPGADEGKTLIPRIVESGATACRSPSQARKNGRQRGARRSLRDSLLD
jgi:hypothetical protein